MQQPVHLRELSSAARVAKESGMNQEEFVQLARSLQRGWCEKSRHQWIHYF